MSTAAQPGGAKSSDLARVWEPLKLGPLTLRNRILQPAHSSQHGDPRDMCSPTDRSRIFASAPRVVWRCALPKPLRPPGARWARFSILLMSGTRVAFPPCVSWPTLCISMTPASLSSSPLWRPRSRPDVHRPQQTHLGRVTYPLSRAQRNSPGDGGLTRSGN